MIKSIRHIGLVVRNTEKALSFYRDFLGFKVYWDKIEEGSFIETITGLSRVKVRTIKMQSLNGCVLELLYYEAYPGPSPVKELQQAGFTHMAITVGDLDKAFVTLKEKGVDFLSLPQISPDNKTKVVFCRDLEGNFLELVQELP